MRINIQKDIVKTKLVIWKGLSLQEIALGIATIIIYTISSVLSISLLHSINVGFFIGSLLSLPLIFYIKFDVYSMVLIEFIQKKIAINKNKAIYYYMPNESELIQQIEKEMQYVETEKKNKRFFKKG